MKRIRKEGPAARVGNSKPRMGEQVRFVIRRAKRSDLAAVVKMSSGVREIENYPGQKMKAGDFAHFVSGYGALMLVAVGTRSVRAKSEVAGYVTVYKSDNYFYLPYAVTKKEWRRHGVGGALLNEVERLAKEEKVEYILMSVYVYNSSVHNFLRERGYVPSKRLVQYSKTITTKGKK